MKSHYQLRIIIFIIAFLIPGGALFCAKLEVLKNPSFQLLSGSYDEVHKKQHSFSKQDTKDLRKFAKNYDKKIGLLGLISPKQVRIPHIIHFVWVGPKPFPEKSIENVASWKKYHPDWQLFFWTDSADRPCPIDGMERHLIKEIHFQQLKPYLSLTTNPAEQADMIRDELIYEYGGVYVDHDVRCFRPFTQFHAAFDFYVGIENPHLNSAQGTKILPGNCLFGAKPHHPILKAAMDNVEKLWYKVEKKYPGDTRKDIFNRIIGRTFNAFTLATKEHLNEDGNIDMVLPSSFFFAQKIFRKKTIKKLKRSDHVFASHAFTYLWQGPKPVNAKKK
ncbi:MAG: hypothetical protein JSR46_01580 [Verrucomicrobia bacterium]|nr:hypothetical protein [Verrucomicrobiota bacterium]